MKLLQPKMEKHLHQRKLQNPQMPLKRVHLRLKVKVLKRVKRLQKGSQKLQKERQGLQKESQKLPLPKSLQESQNLSQYQKLLRSPQQNLNPRPQLQL